MFVCMCAHAPKSIFKEKPSHISGKSLTIIKLLIHTLEIWGGYD